jgi:hypothetical protein
MSARTRRLRREKAERRLMKRAHGFMQQWGTPLPRLRPLAAHVRLAVRIERARLRAEARA